MLFHFLKKRNYVLRNTFLMSILLLLFLQLFYCNSTADDVATTNNQPSFIIQTTETPSRYLYPITVDKKSGFINRGGEIVIPPVYDRVGNFFEGSAWFEDDHLYGYIDEVGSKIIEPRFAEARDFSEGLAAVKDSELDAWGYIDKSGNFVIDPEYDIANEFQIGIARVRTESSKSKIRGKFLDVGESMNYKFIDRKGNFFARKNPFLPELVPFSVNKLYGYRDATTNLERIKPIYESVRPYSEGLTGVKLNDLWGFIDNAGALVVDYQFQDVRDFSEGYAAFRANNQWGYINREGAISIKPRYYWAKPFRGGLAEVTVSGRGKFGHRGYINYDGDFVWKPTNDSE